MVPVPGTENQRDHPGSKEKKTEWLEGKEVRSQATMDEKWLDCGKKLWGEGMEGTGAHGLG